MNNTSEKNSVAEYYFKEGCFITELSNSDADPAVSIAKVRVESGVTTVWHRLAGTVERYLILQGTGLMELENNPKRIVSKDDVVLIEANQAQRISNTGTDDLIFLAICTPRFTPKCYEEAS